MNLLPPVLLLATTVLVAIYPGPWVAAVVFVCGMGWLWRARQARDVVERSQRLAIRDLEEQQRLRAQVGAAKERLRRLIDNSPVAILEFDRSFQVLYANDACIGLLGGAWQHMTDRTLTGLGDAELVERLHVVFEGTCLRHKGALQVGERLLQIDAVFTPVHDADGGIDGGIGVLRDITDQARAERELQRTRDRYADVMEKIPVGIYTLRHRPDGSNSFDYVSPRFCQIMAMSRERLLADGRAAFDAAVPEEREAFLAANERSFRTFEPYRWEGRFRVGGRVRWLRAESDGYPQEDGSSVWNGVLSDVTERHDSEDALRESERSFRDLFQRIPVPVWLFDPGTLRFLMVNQAAIDLYGHASEDFLEMNLHDLCAEESCIADILGRIRTEVVRSVVTHRTRDGRRIVMDMVLRELDLEGVTVGMGVASDVTEERRARAELVEAKVQAEEGSRAKSEFLATMSHEIRTPMNGVLGLLELALGEEADPERRRRLHKARDAGRALRDILDNVLDYTLIDAGHVELEDAEFDPSAAVRGVVDLFESEVASRGLALELEIAPEIPQLVGGDARRLKQILSNLLGNAVKFTQRGRIRVEVFAGDPVGGRIELRFAVRDTGIGISKEVLPRLFRPFQPGDSSMTRRHGGAGLGLAISRDLVERMGGTLSVGSEPGTGSVFGFTVGFRLVEACAGRDSSHAFLPEMEEGPREGRPRILLVEDNQLNQEVARAFLENVGYLVDVAGDGRECLEILESRRYDAILMDLHMPVMGGIEATRKLRFLPNGLDVPVVGLTADMRPSVVAECREAGMAAHVSKPFDPRHLVELLAGLVKRSGSVSPRE